MSQENEEDEVGEGRRSLQEQERKIVLIEVAKNPARFNISMIEN